jgi:FMN phosphatase YigB (HAD superfamily)
MKLSETQQAFKDGYTKARHEDEKWYNDFLRHLQALETEANENIDEIPEEFDDLQDGENYNYYQGVLETVKNIKEFLGV